MKGVQPCLEVPGRREESKMAPRGPALAGEFDQLADLLRGAVFVIGAVNDECFARIVFLPICNLREWQSHQMLKMDAVEQGSGGLAAGREAAVPGCLAPPPQLLAEEVCKREEVLQVALA